MADHISIFSKVRGVADEKMTLPSEILLGVIHLLVNGKLKILLKCPFCDFRNLHEDTITHHIRYTNDPKHDVDIDQLDKSHYHVTRTLKESPYGPYVRTEDLPLPWIQCLWCKYRDKIEFDLSLHMLERHRDKLITLPIRSSDRTKTKALSGDFFARFEPTIEFRLDVAVEMAKRQNRGNGVQNAVRSLQKHILERRRAKKMRRVRLRKRRNK